MRQLDIYINVPLLYTCAMKNEKEKNKLLKRFEKVCKELESLAWKEYNFTNNTGKFTMRQAKVSRKCDGLAIEKRNLRNRLFDEFNIEI